MYCYVMYCIPSWPQSGEGKIRANTKENDDTLAQSQSKW